MSKPVEVSKEVAEILQKNLVEEHSHGLNLYNVLHYIALTYDLEEFLEDDADAQLILDAIKYGYVVPYQFKVGDVVSDENFRSVSVVTKHIVDIYNANKHSLKLICKAENREDIKQ